MRRCRTSPLLYGRSIVGTLHDRVGDEVGFAAPAPVVTTATALLNWVGRNRQEAKATGRQAAAKVEELVYVKRS